MQATILLVCLRLRAELLQHTNWSVRTSKPDQELVNMAQGPG
jgi:hypothetical protein